MKAWIQMPPDKVHTFYAVPFEVAAVDGNTFYGLEHHPFDLDGPWPLSAFLKDKAHPDTATFCIFSVLPEALEFEGFNPLTETGGGLSLDSQTLASLVDLLQNYASRLAPAKSKQKAFKTIEAERIADFRLHPEWFPDSEEYYYLQAYDPLGGAEENPTATILILSTKHTRAPQAALGLYLKIASFPVQKLQDPSFNPLDHALPHIHLDRNGMQEFASLLQERLDHFTG